MPNITKHPAAFTLTTGFNNNFTNPANAYSSDNLYASIVFNARNGEVATCWSDFGFNIPAGATVNSVMVYIERKASSNTGKNSFSASAWLDATSGNALVNSVSGALHAISGIPIVTSDTYYSFALTTLPTVEQLNSASFGIRVQYVQGNNTTSVTVSIDDIYIVVDYTLPTTGIPQASETDLPQIINEVKRNVLVVNDEISISELLNKLKLKSVSGSEVIETAASITITKSIKINLAQCIETESSINVTIEKQQEVKILADTDDGEVYSGSLLTNGESGNIYIGEYSNQYLWGWLRFKLPFDIPSGSIVSSVSNIKVYKKGSYSWIDGQYPIGIWAEKSNNPSVITSVNERPINGSSARTLTDTIIRVPESGGLTWSPYNDWFSFNIAPLIQELVDTFGGLTKDNYIQFWLSTYSINADNNEVSFSDYNNTTTDPKLVVGFLINEPPVPELTQLNELDSSNSVTHFKTKLVNLSDVLEVASPISVNKRINCSLNTEPDLSQQLLIIKNKLLLQLQVIDYTQSFNLIKAKEFSFVSDANVANSIISLKYKSLLVTEEIESSQQLIISGVKNIIVNPAIDNQITSAFDALKRLLLHQPHETNYNSAITGNKYSLLTSATETDVINFLQLLKIKNINSVTELSNSNALIISGVKYIPISNASESSQVHALSLIKELFVGTAINSESVQVINRIKLNVVSQPVDYQNCNALSKIKIKNIFLVNESNLNSQLNKILKRYNIIPIVEIDAANNIRYAEAQVTLLNKVLGTEQALSIIFRNFDADLLNDEDVKSIISEYITAAEYSKYPNPVLDPYLLESLVTLDKIKTQVSYESDL